MSFKKIMASVVAMILCLAMILSFAACTGSDNTEDDNTTDGTTASTTKGDDTTVGGTDETTKGDETTGDVTTEKPAEMQDVTEKRVTNDTYTLVIQESTFDGIFNPFTYSSAYDADVIGLVNSSLLTLDTSGAVVAGDQYDCYAKSYSIYYTNDLNTYAAKENYENGDYVVYEFVLKNGCKFSDGSAITADDVLFNYYVYLDPAYVGSSTLYTLPILGLADYRTQVTDSSKYYEVADKILAAGETYTANDVFTQEQFDKYWAGMQAAGLEFAQEIVDYVVAQKYVTKTDYLNSKYMGNHTAAEFEAEGFKVAAGMAFWGFGSFDVNKTYTPDAKGLKGQVGETYKTLYTEVTEDKALLASADGKFYAAATADTATDACVYLTGANEDGTYNVTAFSGERFTENAEWLASFTDGAGNKYNMTDTFPTVQIYWDVLKASYENDYVQLNSVETAGMDLIGAAAEKYTLAYAELGKVTSISGLIKSKKTIGGEEFETVKIILTQQNPKAILSLGVVVAPKDYYTLGFEYEDGAVVNAGVPLGINNNTKFIKHLDTYDRAPKGAGSYIYKEFKDGDVYFERNEYHYTMGDNTVYNANIKYICMKAVDSGAEYNALKAGDVHYATVSADSSVMEDIAKHSDTISSILVDNLGYGYICINPAATAYGLDNLYARIALTTVFDLSKVKDYYPEGLADVIYRSQSQVSWAYPEGAKAIYEYDGTLAKAVEYYKKAGYTYDEATKKFTDIPALVFYLPSSTNDHPAGGIFLNAIELLKEIGVSAEVKIDDQLIANIKKEAVPVYALAWQAAQDPDMYQVYHYMSAAESVISNGIKYLHDNGKDDTKGTIEVTKLDGSKVTMNQTAALDYLAELIEEGTKYMSVDERSAIYEKALEVLAQLNIELPTYQRKNLFAYAKNIIDGTTMSKTVTPYWSPIVEIWKLSFAEGVNGNETKTVTYQIPKAD